VLLVADKMWKSETRPLLDQLVDAQQSQLENCLESKLFQGVISRVLNENGLGILDFNEIKKLFISNTRRAH